MNNSTLSRRRWQLCPLKEPHWCVIGCWCTITAIAREVTGLGVDSGPGGNTHTAEGIFQRFESEIARGVRRPDELLPSIRELAAEVQVSPATVAAAFRKLADRGLTYVVRGVGTKVRGETLISSALGHEMPPALEGTVNVASGAPDAELLPDPNVYLRRIQVPKTLYDVEPMLPKLRAHANGIMADVLQGRPAHLTVAGGALESISDAVQARLRPGDRVIVEDPGFAAAASLLRSHALTLVPVAVDDEGFELDAFAAAMKRGVSAVLYSPRAQNPYGSTMSANRAAGLRAILRQERDRGRGVFVIENDHASLVTDTEYCSLTEGAEAWVSSRSLSKSHGPDLRFAFVAGDELTIDRLQRRQALNKGWISTIIQHLVVELLSDEEVLRATTRARAEYSRRRSRLVDALGTLGVSAHGRSGLNVLVPVNDEGSVSNSLVAYGWQVRSGQAYRHKSHPFIRLTPAALSDEQIDTLAAHTALSLQRSTVILR